MGGKKGASDRRQANGTGGRLPDGRLMEPRTDFIFRGPSSHPPVPSTVRDRSPLLSSRQGAEIQYDLSRGGFFCYFHVPTYGSTFDA